MKEDQQQVVGLNIKDGRGGIRGELDTNAALLLQPQIATNNQCRACRVWYDEGWRVNVAFPAFHQREPITVEQVHEPIFGRYTGNECVVDVGSRGTAPVCLLVQNEIDTITDASG